MVGQGSIGAGTTTWTPVAIAAVTVDEAPGYAFVEATTDRSAVTEGDVTKRDTVRSPVPDGCVDEIEHATLTVRLEAARKAALPKPVMVECSVCEGQGSYVTEASGMRDDGTASYVETEDCSACDGTAWVAAEGDEPELEGLYIVSCYCGVTGEHGYDLRVCEAHVAPFRGSTTSKVRSADADEEGPCVYCAAEGPGLATCGAELIAEGAVL